MNNSKLAQKWAQEGFSCDLWIDPPGQTWEDYVHTVDEVVCVESGTVEFEIGGVKKTLKPGVEAFIPAGVTHSVRNIGGTTACWFYGYRHHSR